MLGYGALYMASTRSAGRELVHEHCDYVCAATLLTNAMTNGAVTLDNISPDV